MIREIPEDRVEMVFIYLEVNLLSICWSRAKVQKLLKETFISLRLSHSFLFFFFFHIKAGYAPKEHFAPPVVFLSSGSNGEVY